MNAWIYDCKVWYIKLMVVRVYMTMNADMGTWPCGTTASAIAATETQQKIIIKISFGFMIAIEHNH